MGSRPLKPASSRWLGRDPARDNPWREASRPYCDEVNPSGVSARSRATRHRNDRCQRRYPVDGGPAADDDMSLLYMVIVIMYMAERLGRNGHHPAASLIQPALPCSPSGDQEV
jgi:hypothetical protein